MTGYTVETFVEAMTEFCDFIKQDNYHLASVALAKASYHCYYLPTLEAGRAFLLSSAADELMKDAIGELDEQVYH